MHSVGVRFQADWPLQNPNGHIIEKIYLGQDAAKSSKLAPGDVVTHVDGAETKTWSPDILRRALQGVAGTMVAITFLPQGGKEPDSVQLRRGSSSYWQTGEERDALRQHLESLTNERREDHDKLTSELAKVTEQRHALKEDNDRLQDTEQQLAEKARAIKLQLEKKESEAIGLKTLVASLETSVDNMRQEIIRLRQQYAETTEALHDAQKQAKLLTSDRDAATQREETSQQQLLEYVERNSTLEQVVSSLEAALAKAEANCAPASEGPLVCDLKLKVQASEHNQLLLETRVADIEAQATEEREAAQEAKNEARILRINEEALKADVDRARADAARYKAALEVAQNEYEPFRREAQRASARAASDEKELLTLREQLKDATAALASSSSKCLEAMGTLELKEQELSQAKQTVKSLTEVLERTQAALSSAESSAAASNVDVGSLTSERKVLLEQQERHEATIREKHELSAWLTDAQNRQRDAQEKLHQSERVVIRQQKDLDQAMLMKEEAEHKASSIQGLLTDAYSVQMRASMEEVWKMSQERDRLQEELNRFQLLPNPVGIGLRLGELVPPAKSQGDHDKSWRQIRVTGISVGLAADLSGVVHVGDLIEEVDGVAVGQLALDEIKERIAGPRGSRVSLCFRRLDNETVCVDQHGCITVLRADVADDDVRGLTFVATFRRGAWGKESCIVSPEDTDTIDKGRWTQSWGRTGEKEESGYGGLSLAEDQERGMACMPQCVPGGTPITTLARD